MQWGPFPIVCIIWNKSRLQKSYFYGYLICLDHLIIISYIVA